jgi:hypothetical protein
MITPGRRSDFRCKLCPIQDMLHQYILYTQRLEHTCQHRFSQTVLPTQNSTHFKYPVCHLIFLSQLQAPHQSTHTLHTTSRMDRQTRFPHDAVYCTSQTLLINHEYGLTNLQCHKAQDIPYVIKIIQQLRTWNMHDGRTDGRTARLTWPSHCIRFLHILWTTHNRMWFQVSSTV